MFGRIFISAFIAGLITYTFYVIRGHTLIVRDSKRKELLERAIKKGHVVTARLVTTHTAKPESRKISDRQDMAVYMYEYRGKTYKRRIPGSIPFPVALTLYFDKTPRKAVPQSQLAYTSFPYGIVFLILFMLVYLFNSKLA